MAAAHSLEDPQLLENEQVMLKIDSVEVYRDDKVAADGCGTLYVTTRYPGYFV